MDKKRALVFGASGQAGQYLCMFLGSKGYEVHGTYCTHKVNDRLAFCNINDPFSVEQIITIVHPDEVYNMASLMFSPYSWDRPLDYTTTNYYAVVTMLACLQRKYPKCKFFQGGSAEVLQASSYPMYEGTPYGPRNPYGVAKMAAQELVKVYRAKKGMFACTGIFFNMESPLRQDTFFSCKVVKEVVRIRKEIDEGKKNIEPLRLGKIHAIRDWGYTKEYVEAAWLMLQAKRPEDYVISTGFASSCATFIEIAFDAVGIGADEALGKYLIYEQSRKEELGSDYLCGDSSKIYNDLGWKAKTLMPDLVKFMVESEMMKHGVSPNTVR